MAIMKKQFRVLPEQITTINSIFKKNNINVSFENFNDYKKSLNQICLVMHKSRSDFIKSKLDYKYLLEYDLSSPDKPTDKSIAYRFDTAFFHSDQKIHLQMQIIRDYINLSLQKNSIFDLDGEGFGVIYFPDDVDMKMPRGYYYSLAPDILKNSEKSLHKNFLLGLYIEKTSVEYLTKFIEFNNLDLGYLSFDGTNTLRNVGFSVDSSDEVCDILNQYHSSYIKFTDVINFIKNNYSKDRKIGLQYSNISTKNISIEIPISKELLYDYLIKINDIYEISNIEKWKIHNNDCEEDGKNYVLKFKWSNSKKFSLKLYDIFMNQNYPAWMGNRHLDSAVIVDMIHNGIDF